MKALMTIIILLQCCALQAQEAGDFSAVRISYERPQGPSALARNFEELANLSSNKEMYFSAACHWTLAGENQDAFRCLFQAAEHGFAALDWLQQEKDLDPLKNTLHWNLLILQIEANAQKQKILLD